METREKQPEKSAYHRPKVRDFGNIAEITKTSGPGGTVTDAMTGSNKSR